MTSPFNPQYKPKKPFARFLLAELGWVALGLVLCAGVALAVATHLEPAQRARLEREFPPLAEMRASLQEGKLRAQQAEAQRAREVQKQQAIAKKGASDAQALPKLTDSPSDYPTTFWGRIQYKYRDWWGHSDKRNGIKN